MPSFQCEVPKATLGESGTSLCSVLGSDGTSVLSTGLWSDLVDSVDSVNIVEMVMVINHYNIYIHIYIYIYVYICIYSKHM